jgi:hypothetical protein
VPSISDAGCIREWQITRHHEGSAFRERNGVRRSDAAVALSVSVPVAAAQAAASLAQRARL